MFKQPYKKADYLTPAFNVGAGLDIPNTRFFTGIHGESLANGGQAMLNGFVGGGNLFKTTVMLYKELTMTARAHKESTASMYETEHNTQPGRIVDLSQRIPQFAGRDIVSEEIFVVSNGKQYTGDEWYDETKTFLQSKIELAKKKEYRAKFPFLEQDSTSILMEGVIPTSGALDSFTDFQTKDASKMNADIELGGKGAETLFMKQGIQKLRLLSELPSLLHKANHYFSMTAQVGPVFNLDQYNPEKKKLTAIQGNVKMKGVTDKFMYIMNSILQFYNLEKMIHKQTKMPLFPRDEYDRMEGDSDLNILTAVELRGKSGPSGVPLKLIVSQKSGVMASMTEFYNLWTHPDSFGLQGNDQNYQLVLRPDVKLSRTKVRTKIDEDPWLQRALNISMELMQINRMFPEFRNKGWLCTAEELFQGVKEKGYDWDMILGNTRGWWTMDNDEHPIPYLSTLDLMKMRVDQYKPYWL